jgi:hypothetical protein
MKILSMKINTSIHTPCYDGWLLSFKGGPHDFHNFLYCYDDFTLEEKLSFVTSRLQL